ncbi:diguanylate cyclase (GGDEF) domain-containing protein [Butyrivibrio sp. ob235]|uniref:GGDEF domain-containing protein n=1 Tax=Butyrivibrio sp. ob235 TaxID=1761780 RepID=UPI0008ABED4B|nr:GGDEF domain-containing protein [Butyrivibrio sp. ob235]SEL49944.1 diguanylate cyclase (GGDEF) domain-containing protein [Butyrivibrio sp. ob235]
MSEALYYTEANIACTIILGLILIKINQGIDRQTSTIVLRRMILVLMGYFLSDAVWALFFEGIIPSTQSAMFIVSIIPYAFIVACSYCWFIFCELNQQNKDILSRKGVIKSAVPMIVAILLILFGAFGGIVFSFDESGTLLYGPLYAVLVLVPIGYMVHASIKAFIRVYTQERYIDHGLYFVIGIFPLLPIVCGVLQLIFLEIPIMCFGATLSILQVYLTSLEDLISMDSLTQVNNRHQMQRYLLKKMKTPTPGLSLYLMIIDVDHFREINDNYGHIEGDKALVRVSTAMKEACQAHRNRFFVSRYGGDEFIIIAETEYKGEVNWLSDKIRSSVKILNEKAAAPYDLSVCVGIAEYDYSSPVPIPSLIARAGTDLYHMKHAKA